MTITRDIKSQLKISTPLFILTNNCSSTYHSNWSQLRSQCSQPASLRGKYRGLNPASKILRRVGVGGSLDKTFNRVAALRRTIRAAIDSGDGNQDRRAVKPGGGKAKKGLSLRHCCSEFLFATDLPSRALGLMW